MKHTQLGAAMALAVTLAGTATVAGCGGSGAPSSSGSGAAAGTSTSATSGSAGSGTGSGAGSSAAPTNAGGGAACRGVSMNQPGVVRLFCDGPATATVTLAGKKLTFRDGTCADESAGFSANFGVVTTTEFTGTRPDYLGVTLLKEGPGSIAVVSGGTSYAVVNATVTMSPDKKSVHGEGALMRGNGTAVVDVTCS